MLSQNEIPLRTADKSVSQNQGFTLLEILLVVAAIAILAGIVIIAINPGKQLADTKNAQRQININTILNAVYQYAIDNIGQLPANITTAPKEICRSGQVCLASQADLSVLTANGKYIVSIPTDPIASNTVTGYFISKDVNGRVTVSSTYAENGKVIAVTR